MKHDEFIENARYLIGEAFTSFGNRMLNLIEQAYAEGKRNAETEAVMEIVQSAMKDACAMLKTQEVGGDATD